jgi:hypothetical protein
MHPGKSHGLELVEKVVEDAKGVGAVDAGQHRGVAGDRKHFPGHLHHDVVGITIRHEPGKRSSAGHAVAARIVDHDQVDAAGLLAFGRQPSAGAAADDGLSTANFRVQSI